MARLSKTLPAFINVLVICILAIGGVILVGGLVANTGLSFVNFTIFVYMATLGVFIGLAKANVIDLY